MTTGPHQSTHRPQTGFTLVELVVVIVILSIIAVIGGGFIAKSTESYRSSMTHAQLVQQARQALERASREIRHALPNSIRINGSCMEWLPVVGAGHYEGLIAGQEITSLTTTPITVHTAEAHYLSLGALTHAELYDSGSAALAPLQAPLAIGTPITSVSIDTSIFRRDSAGKRAFLVGKPRRLCLSNGRFTLHDDGQDEGVLLARVGNWIEETFQLEGHSEVRNSIVILTLPIEVDGQRIVLEHKVMIRNVP